MFHTKKLAKVSVIGVVAILAGCAATEAGPTADATLDPDEPVTLDFAFWGNDVRAELYNEAIAAFNDEHPNITVNATFLAWDNYWEKRQTEAAAGDLPDVFQMDMTYLRQYSDNGLVLPLDPYLDGLIGADGFDPSVLDIARVGEDLAGIPISTNALGMFENTALVEQLGIESFAGTWDEYSEWIVTATEAATAAGVRAWGGGDPAGTIQAFELMLRSEGKSVFTADDELGFTRDDLVDFWARTADLRDAGMVMPQQRVAEIAPLGGFDAAELVSTVTWDSMGAGFLASLPADYQELTLVAPPVTVEGAQDLYMKAGMLLSAASSTESPEAAAVFIDFMVNDPGVGEIFGTSRGMPASETQRAGVDMDAAAQQMVDYEASVADRIGSPPPVPLIGYGSVEAKFKALGEELGFGVITPEDAADQLIAEIDVILAG